MRSSSVASAVYLLAVLAFLFSIQMYGADVHASTTDSSRPSVPLNAMRKLPSDLEVGGDLAELAKGATRYVTLDSLLALPLVTYTVTDDPKFSGPTKISGIALEDLAPLLGADPSADLVAAICDDKYRAAYPRAYLKEHHPLLVLLVNGEPSSRWPKDPGTHRYDMGPYMISHPKFTPSFKILSHSDEAQIPWGVVRLEFRNEKAVFSAIAPRGPHADDVSVQAGYKIALQNCFRCHNSGRESEQKSGRPWLVLGAFASAAPAYFSAYVRDPKKENAQAQMPGNPGYDDATLRALRDYFATFVPAEKR
jgi:mono/diheme cytochrome c family protein